MELAIRWNQQSTPANPSFLLVDVPGQTFKHCRVDSIKDKNVRWRELSRNNRVPQFRAFDWSFPHNVVAVGQWSGEVAVLGLHNSDPSLSIPLKTHRGCNSVAFNSESLLATGFERVRNDFCLNVYDIGHWAGSTPESLPPRQPANEPLRKLAVSEGIVSIKFFLQQPNVLVTGVKGVGVRIYDLRETQSSPALQYNTSCVHNIAIDPCNPNQFASAGPPKEDTVQVWDRRSAGKQSANNASGQNSYDAPLLDLKNVFKIRSQGEPSTIWSLRYSIANKGSLGVLSNQGSVRIFETKRDWIETDHDKAVDPTTLLSPISVTRTESLGTYPYQERLEVSSGEVNQKILAFDFLNMLEPGGKPAAITLRAGQDIQIRQLHLRGPALATRFASRASIALSTNSKKSSTGMHVFQASQSDRIAKALLAVNRKGNPMNDDTAADLDEDENANDGWRGEVIENGNATKSSRSRSRSGRRTPHRFPLCTVEDALTIAERSRRRCSEGYLLNPEHNAEIVSGNRELELMWRWISVAKDHAESGSLAQGPINFNYLGVLNIWQNDIGSDVNARMRSGTNKGEVWKRVIEQVKDLGLPKIEIPETDRAYHRWLCLYILGFDPTPDTLLEKVKSLALSGRNSEAALHALLARDPALASTALRSGPRNSQNKALSLLLAVYATSEDRRSLVDQLNAVIGSEKDPYAQAVKHLLTLRITNTEMASLPEIPLLPPQYHIALAISLLSDAALKNYLFEQYREAVSGGLLSQIPLTGLSQLSIRIFKRYLVHTSDLQTVVLALSHVCPLYINKPRMNCWRAEYRSNLNRYGLFIKRAQFDMQSTKLATRPDGPPALEVQKRQISLKCANCDSALHREPDRFVPEGITPSVDLPNIQTPLSINPATGTPTLQTSTSDPTFPSTSTDSNSPFQFDSNPINTIAPNTTTTSAAGAVVPATTSTLLPGPDTRGSGFRTPTSPHGSLYSNSGMTPTTPHPQNRLFPAPRDGTLCPRCGARMPRCAVCEFWIGETDPRSRGARSTTASSIGTTIAVPLPSAATMATITPTTATVPARIGNAVVDENVIVETGEGDENDSGGAGNMADGTADLLAGFVEVCLRCRHVYHRAHAEAWFEKHDECAAVGCRCVCASLVDGVPQRASGMTELPSRVR